ASDLNLTIEAAKQLVYRARCRLRDAAGILVPPGLLHSLAGEAASAPALLVKGGVAAGVLTGALFVGMAPQPGTTQSRRTATADKPSTRVCGTNSPNRGGSL